MIEAVISVVSTGRRMQVSEKTHVSATTRPCARARATLRAVGEQKLAVGHHRLATRQAARKCTDSLPTTRATLTG